MGFHLRKSINLGGIRLNLSNSGVGFSTGVKGLRVGIDGKGRTYIGGGKGILRYRKTLSSGNSPKEILIKREELPTELKDFFIANIIILILASPVFIYWIGTFFLIFDKKFGVGPFIFFSIPCIFILWSFFINKRNHKINKGIKAFNNQEYNIAIKLLDPFIDYNFKTSEAAQYIRNIILNSYIESEQYEQAIDFTRRRCIYNSREKVVTCLYKLEKFEELIKYIQEEYSEDERQEHPTVIAILADAFLKLNQNEIALETMLQGPVNKRKMDEEMCAFRYMLAQCFEANNDSKNALKQYQKVYAFDVNYEDVKEKIENLNY